MMRDGSRLAPGGELSTGTLEAGDGEAVMFLDDLAALLRVSRSTIERRRREGSFPIPELDALDRRPRWSRRAVERYLASAPRAARGRRRRPRSRAD